MKKNPYKYITRNGVQITQHQAIAEEVLGRALPAGACVHHADGNPRNNAKTNLVICPSKAYHNLLHARMDAQAACGNANWMKCQYCKRYDDPKQMFVRNEGKGRQAHHRACRAEYELKRYYIRKENRCV